MGDSDEQFQKEVSWCILALRKVLQKRDPSRNQIKQALTALQVLESSKAPMVKKRLAMRNSLGDYRAKMAAEEKLFDQQVLSGNKKMAEFFPEEVAAPPAKVLAKAVTKPATPEKKTFAFEFKV